MPLKLPPLAAALAGAALAALEIGQRLVSIGGTWHDVITVAVLLTAGLGVLPTAARALVKFMPHQVAVALTTLATMLQIVQEAKISISPVAHSIIGAILVFAAAIGITVAARPAAAPPRTHRRSTSHRA